MTNDNTDTIQELRGLAESWRDEYDHPTTSLRRNAKALAKQECARELLEVINDG